ncbi:MAG: hypothetical protein ABFS86_06235 [Planctomycetota bacterium]
MTRLAGWLLVLALLAAPAFAADEAPDAPAPKAEAETEAAPEAEAEADTEADTEAEGESFSSTVADVEEFLANQPLKFYGHFKLDMAMDSARTNDGNTAMWVEKQPDGDDDDEFNMTARHTRFGFTYAAPESWGPKATAKFEIDFYGGSPENKAGVRLRHAFMNFEFENGIELLAGQAWDLPLPHQQQKLNTAVGWNQGNAAYRRPQVRGTYTGQMGDDGKWDIAIAIADPIAKDIDGFGDDDGEDAGIPDFQWRASIAWKLFEDAPPMVIGLGGVMGQREADLAAGDEEYDTWLIGLDILFPISKKLKILAEVYTSQAASSYNASLGYDYNAAQEAEIEASGWFINAVWKMDKYWKFVIGAGVVDLVDGDLDDGDRSANSSIFANVHYSLKKDAWIGLEVDSMKTDYKAEDNFNNLRVQLCFCLKF